MSKEEDKEYRKQFEKDWCISDEHFKLAKPFPTTCIRCPPPAARK